MSAQLDLAAEALRAATQIKSLAMAAQCLITGDHPTDKLAVESAALAIIDLIGELAEQAENSMDALEMAVRQAG